MSSVRIGFPAVLDRIGTGHAVIQASAGTGKTYTLEHLVVDLLLQGVALEEICVVTFTQKAALELRSRVRAKLEALVALREDTAAEGEPARVIGPTERAALDTALRAFDRATLDTIHGFCQQILRDSAFEGGRLFRQEAVASEEAFWTAFRTLARTRFAQGADRDLFALALEHFKGFEALGTFLKQALAERSHLELPDSGPLEAALEAFPADLAEALCAELEGGGEAGPGCPMLLGLKAGKVYKTSYGKLRRVMGALLEAWNAWRNGAEPRTFWLLAGGDLAGYEVLAKPGFTGETARLAEAFETLRAQATTPEAVFAGAFLEAIADEMARWKQERGLYDFDDMIQLVKTAVTGPGGEGLVKRLRDRFRVALIDEFQDTDANQWAIFRKLFLEAEEGRHRLILVGDPKQAIYGFRGGDLPTYLTAVEEVQRRSGRPAQELDTNHRSTREVIERCNTIFDQGFFTGGNADHYVTAVKCGKTTLRIQDGDGQPLPALQVLEIPEGSAASMRREAAQAIARTLRDLLARGPRLAAGETARPIGPEGIFVLTRTGKEGLEIAQVLREHGLPCAFYKQEGLFESPEALAIRDLLLAVEQPWDESRRAKALLGPFFGFSFREAERSRDLPEHHPVLRRLAHWGELARTRRFAEFFSSLVRDSGITRRQLFLSDSQRGLTNILHILEALHHEALSRHATLADLARTLQAWIQDQDRPSGDDADTQRLERTAGAIQIMTMHKSKGLEAPVVALFGAWSEGSTQDQRHRFHDPSQGRRVWLGSRSAAPKATRDRIAREAQEEGERLAYVALTRAQGQLILPRLALGKAKGPYANLNARLHDLEASESSSDRASDFRPLQPPKATVAPLDASERLADWTPPLLPPLPQTAFDDWKKRSRPTWVFSFSSLAHLSDHGDEGRLDEPAVPDAPMDPEDGPRGGARLGTAVHALFEEMPLDTFQETDFERWLSLPVVAERLQRHHPGEGRRVVAEWIHRGLGRPLPLPGGGSTILAEAGPRLLRELDFLTPYPVGKDLLTGSIDALFEWQGRTFILDWKTNRLPEYGPSAVGSVVQESYGLQVKVYTLTTCRFLGIDNREAYEQLFGGVIYVFVRGLRHDQGVWTHRPTWEEVLGYRSDLADLPLARLIPAAAGGAQHV